MQEAVHPQRPAIATSEFNNGGWTYTCIEVVHRVLTPGPGLDRMELAGQNSWQNMHSSTTSTAAAAAASGSTVTSACHKRKGLDHLAVLSWTHPPQPICGNLYNQDRPVAGAAPVG
eukprot:gene24476-biopygen20898